MSARAKPGTSPIERNGIIRVGYWPSYAERSEAAEDNERERRQKLAEERADHCYGDTEGDEPDVDTWP
jgi:hypothetical protein